MAAITIAELADFFSRACPDVWATFLAQRQTPAAERPTVLVDDPMSPSTGPATPTSVETLYDVGSPAPSALSTRGPSPAFSDAETGSEMEFDVAKPAMPDDEGFTVVSGKKRKRPAAKKGAEPHSAPSSPSSSPNATPAKKTAPSARPKIAKIANSEPAAVRKEKPPPPIILQDKSRWSNLSHWIDSKKIFCPKVHNGGQGIRIHVSTTDDFRALTAHLKVQKLSFHTYALAEERNLRVVVRGLPKELETEHILSDLKSQNLPVREVHRMHHPTDKKRYLDLCLVILDLSPEGKEIYNIRRICNLTGITVEAPRNRGIVGQCHRCQLYGHSAKNCYAKPRCVKCLGDHGTPECTRTPESEGPPSCVLCGEAGHPANYRGCTKAPRRKWRGGANRRGRAASASRSRPRQHAPSLAPISVSQPAPPQPHTKPAPAKGSSGQGVSSSVPSAPASNAWVKPPAIVSAAASRPAPSLQAQKPKLAPQASSTFAADFSLVCSFFNNINVAEVSSLARKLREAKSAQDKLNATIEHINLIDAIGSFQCA
ncbi:unnamed protein product [Parnassius mnemosyne]|uniref:Pre-C2HC domain-containing protein n=1 Tax=Parnassius mnemosyne TaxID=213953 RepID=A0AAV1LNA6_9NEOP